MGFLVGNTITAWENCITGGYPRAICITGGYPRVYIMQFSRLRLEKCII